MHLERMVGAESLEGDGPCDSGPPPRPQLCACRWTCRPTTRASSSASCNPLRPAGTSQHSFARGWARQQGHSATACPELPGLSQRSQLHLLWLLCGTPWVAQPGRGSSMAGHRGQLSPGAGFHVSGQAPCQAVGPRSPHGTTLLPPIKSGGLCPTSSFPRAPAWLLHTVPLPETHLGWGLSLHHHPPAPAQSPAAHSRRAVQSSRASCCTRGFGAAGRLLWVGGRADPSATQPSLLLLLPRLGVHGEGMRTDKLQGRELQNGDNC